MPQSKDLPEMYVGAHIILTKLIVKVAENSISQDMQTCNAFVAVAKAHLDFQQKELEYKGRPLMFLIRQGCCMWTRAFGRWPWLQIGST